VLCLAAAGGRVWAGVGRAAVMWGRDPTGKSP
jgi:hypothetical protein